MVQNAPLELRNLSHGQYSIWDGNSDKSVPTPEPGTQAESSPEDHDRVAFLVHKSIPTEFWHARRHEGSNSRLAATLTFSTTCGDIAFHNVYNWKNKAVIGDLRQHLVLQGADAVVGDLNLHHPSWPRKTKSRKILSASAKEFHGDMKNTGMTLCNEPGIITSTRSIDCNNGKGTTIDLTFVGNAIDCRKLDWRVVPVRGFESDHRVTETTLDMEPNRLSDSVFLWHRVDMGKYWAGVKQSMEYLGRPSLNTEKDIDSYVDRFLDSMYSTIYKVVPRTERQRPQRKISDTPQIRHHRKLADNALTELQTTFDAEARSRLRDVFYENDNEANKLQRIEAMRSFRHWVADGTKTMCDVWPKARLGELWRQPKTAPQMPDFVIEDEEYRSGAAKAECFRKHVFLETSDEGATPIPLPPEIPVRRPFKAPQELREGEVMSLFNALKRRKAPGLDEIGNPALKMAKMVLVGPVEHLFRACVRLSYHPNRFKSAKTIVFRKKDKEAYNVPKSWRPIALLSSLGKMLEKLIANRLQDECISHMLLPATQFAAPGKCTTSALRCLFNQVYRGWCMEKQYKTTVMSLDMEGV